MYGLIGDGGRWGWLVRDFYRPINCSLLINSVTRETHLYAPLILLINPTWFRGVPIFTVPFAALSLAFGAYSLMALQIKSSTSLFFYPYSSEYRFFPSQSLYDSFSRKQVWITWWRSGSKLVSIREGMYHMKVLQGSLTPPADQSWSVATRMLSPSSAVMLALCNINFFRKLTSNQPQTLSTL